MFEESLSREFRLKNIEERKTYLIEEMSKKHKNIHSFKLYWALTYFNFYSNRCFSISAFAPLVGIPIGIRSSSIGLKNCVITSGIKKYKLIILKKKKICDEIVLLSKSKLNSK